MESRYRGVHPLDLASGIRAFTGRHPGGRVTEITCDSGSTSITAVWETNSIRRVVVLYHSSNPSWTEVNWEQEIPIEGVPTEELGGILEHVAAEPEYIDKEVLSVKMGHATVYIETGYKWPNGSGSGYLFKYKRTEGEWSLTETSAWNSQQPCPGDA